MAKRIYQKLSIKHSFIFLQDCIACFHCHMSFYVIFSERERGERELTFTFAICYHRPSVVCLSSVTFVRPTQAVQIFGNISMALGTLAIH